ncbi:MAG: PASTA domain-containing protein [Pseudomonadota bacterium]
MELTAPKWIARVGYFLLFFLVLGLSATATVRFLVHRGSDVEVPALVGKTVTEAEALLTQEGLRLDIQGSQYNNQYTDGSVVYQLIAAGERVRSGRTVGVYLSKGARELLAPRLVGLTLDAARTILKSSDLSDVVSAATCSDEIPDGTVVAQDPPPGGAVEKEQMQLLRSDGPCRDRFVMPDLAGRSASDVLKDLDRNGFVIRSFRYVEREGVEPRTVLNAEPKPGSIVHPNDPVVLTLASAVERTASGGGGSFRHVVVHIPPGLFKRQAELWLESEGVEGSRSIDFQTTPGENTEFILWITPGSQAAVMMDGRPLWRKGF